MRDIRAARGAACALIVAWAASTAVLASPARGEDCHVLAEVAVAAPGVAGVGGVPALEVLGDAVADAPWPAFALSGGTPGGAGRLVVSPAGSDAASQVIPFAFDARGAALVDLGASAVAACGRSVDVRALVADAAAPGGVASSVTLRLTAGFAPDPDAPLFGAVQYDVRGGAEDFAVGDVTGDGVLDLVVPTDAELVVLAGLGDGAFVEASRVPAGAGAVAIELADLDDDGDLDAVTANADSSDIAVFLSLGPGGFAAPQRYAVDDTPLDVVCGDFDGNGSIDVAVAFAVGDETAFELRLGGADGTLDAPIPGGSPAEALDAADLDGDGRTDLVTSHDSVDVWRSLGDGAVEHVQSIAFWSHMYVDDVSLVDLDGDGDIDIVGSYVYQPYFYYPSLRVEFNDGGALFTTSESSEFQHIAHVIATDDIDGDGTIDVIGTRKALGAHDLTIVEGADMLAGISEFRHLPSGGLTRALRTADVDDDGTVDILALDDTSQIAVLLGSAAEPLVGMTSFPAPGSTTVADLNQDGLADVIAAAKNRLHVLGVKADGEIVGNGWYDLGVRRAFAGDVDSDGRVDLVVHLDTDGAAWMRGYGAGLLDQPQPVSIDGDVDRLSVLDVDGDGALDLVDSDGHSDRIALRHGRGDGSFEAKVVTPWIGRLAAPPAWSDADGDGDVDAWIVDADDGELDLLLASPDGTFVAAGSWSVGSSAMAVAVGDLDDDGDSDAVVTVRDADSIRVFLGDGRGGLEALGDVPTGPEPIEVVVVDVDADGMLDVVTANQGRGVSVLPGRGDGSFAERVDHATGGPYVEASPMLTVSDVTGDGRPDILVADRAYKGNFLRLFRQ